VIVDEVLVCDCGFEARAADEEALVEQIRRHASEAHGMTLSHDEALTIARIARNSTARTNEEER
jgi:predicted small metal-binding protein